MGREEGGIPQPQLQATLPGLFVFISWLPRKPFLARTRELGNQLAWLWPCSEDREKSSVTEAQVLLLQEQKGSAPHHSA